MIDLLKMVDKNKRDIEVYVQEKIGQGSNSIVYSCKVVGCEDIDNAVVKIPPNSRRYVSTKLQAYSYEKASIIGDDKISIPKMYCYNTSDEFGDLLLLERKDNIYSLDFIIKNNLYYTEEIIILVAKALARLHKLKISGYDLEFSWDVINNQLVLLDIGPCFTFDNNVRDMLEKHFDIEKNHITGRWNIISQILPCECAISTFENDMIMQITVDDLVNHMKEDAISLHIKNAAETHALSLLGLFPQGDINKYIKLFKRSYIKEYVGEYSISNMTYLKAFEMALQSGKKDAEVQLYYSKEKTLSKTSCRVQIEI